MSLRAYRLSIAGLVVALVGTNVWWALQNLALSLVRDAVVRQRTYALADALAVLPALAHELPRDTVIARIVRTLGVQPPSTQDSILVADLLAFRFDHQGRLTSVAPAFPTPVFQVPEIGPPPD